MTISRRDFTTMLGAFFAASAMPGIAHAGGGAKEPGDKSGSTNKNSYSEMSAKQLEEERFRLNLRIKDQEERAEDLVDDVRYGDRLYKREKAAMDQMFLDAERETDAKTKRKLTRKAKKAARDLESSKLYQARDIQELEDVREQLIRLKADKKSVEKWIKFRKSAGG